MQTAKSSYGESANPQLVKLRQHLDNRLIGLRVDRYSWWVHWRELADYILPRRYKWLVTPNQAARGSPMNQRIIDSTATLAMRVLAAGMMSGITSPGRPWFKLKTADEESNDLGPVKLWLDECQKRMLVVFAESNYYTCKSKQYETLSVFGTAPMIIYEDYHDVIRCYVPMPGEFYVANSARLTVDTLYREYVMTTWQVASEFGLGNCSETVRSAIKTGGAMLTREVKIGHAIEPNNEYVPQMPGTKGMPYREVYWELGQGQNEILRMKGFHESPFNCPRWDQENNDAYGRSPAMDALGDIKQLQVEQKRKSQAIDKMVNPPLIADVQLKNEPASVLPGGVTYVTSIQGVGMKPIYEVKPDLSQMVEDIKEVQARIKSTFFNDLFLMISQLDTVRTATEIDARKEEKLIQLGPVLERFEGESLNPDIDRVFNIMLRAGLLPPLPKELAGQHIQVEYISMLAESQKAISTAGIERLSQFVGNIAGAVPGALDNIEWDELIDLYADYLGCSPKVIVPITKVLKMRQQRAQQQQQQAVMQQSMAAVQGAQTLSQTDVGGGKNALQMMMGVQ